MILNHAGAKQDHDAQGHKFRISFFQEVCQSSDSGFARQNLSTFSLSLCPFQQIRPLTVLSDNQSAMPDPCINQESPYSI